MLLLATQAEPQMVEHAHPNLGRLIQPRHYNALPATIARGVPWAADNDCYQGKRDLFRLTGSAAIGPNIGPTECRWLVERAHALRRLGPRHRV